MTVNLLFFFYAIENGTVEVEFLWHLLLIIYLNLEINLETYYFTLYYLNRLHNNDEVVRMREVMTSIEETGTYTLTEQELSFGAKLAWRNASRCIGRKQWLNLKVRQIVNVYAQPYIFNSTLQFFFNLKSESRQKWSTFLLVAFDNYTFL